MTIEEFYQPVKHRATACPVCATIALIQDISKPRNDWDKLIIAIRNNNAAFRILQGKRIEVKEG